MTSDGGSPIIERGVVYSSSLNPVITDSKIVSAGTVGTYSATLTMLTAGTTYFVRAYAKNAAGISYGDNLTFALGTPAVTTDLISNIASSSVTVRQ